MIKISVVSYNNEISSEPLSAVFGPADGTIGRSNDNFMVLQDPKRYVSRVQASVKSDGARHFIVNLSQANPILVNGEQIDLGEDVELHHGDEIQIGLYLLRAESPDAVAPAAKIDVERTAFIPSPIHAVQPAPAASSSPAPKAAGSQLASFDLSNAGASGGNPFADLLGDDASISGVPAPTPTVTPIAATPTKPAPVATPTRTVPFLGADPLGLDDLLATNAPARSNVPPSTAEAARDTAIDPLGFDDLLGLSSAQAAADSRPAGKVDPFGFDDLLAPASPPAARPAAPIRASPATGDNVFGFDDLLSGPSHMPLLQEGNTPIIPEDFDPFAMPSEAPRNTSDPLSALSNNDVSLESISGNKVTIDGLMSSAGAGEPSPLDPIALGPARSSETDPLALFASEPILPSKHDDIFLGDVASNHVSELKSHFSMPHAVPETMPNALPEALKLHPAPMPPTPQVTTPQPVAPQATTSKPLPPANEQPAAPNQMPVDGRALAEAFLRGANLPLDTLPAGVTLEWMEMMGRFVATATDGAVELIASRALVKREVKADLTMIVVRNNNPLKFLPDGRSALIQMLGKKIPGFMGPVEAMEDAYVDLRAHQIGVVAGMRAALDEVLRRFDPAMLEKKLKSRSLMDSLVAANRKAKMWDLYAELFKDIYAEAQDDFQTLFGKAFLAAYESEIERFRQGRKP